MANDKLQEMIDALVSERVESVLEARIAELLNGKDDAGIASKRADYATARSNRSALARETYLRESGQVPGDDAPRRRRRSRGRRPRLGYVIVPKRGRQSEPDLFATAAQVWNAIVKHDKKNDSPISVVDIEKATGLGKKTVESCVYYLRRHTGDGQLVADGKGMITAMPLAIDAD